MEIILIYWFIFVWEAIQGELGEQYMISRSLEWKKRMDSTTFSKIKYFDV